MGIKKWIVKAGQKAGDGVTKLSVLSPAQVEEVQTLRDTYFEELAKFDPKTDPAAIEYTNALLAANAIEIYDAYLPLLKDLYSPVEKDAEFDTVYNTEYNIRYFNITKWVTEKTENSLEKLVNVYAVLANESCNIALVFHRSCDDTKVYIAVSNEENDTENINAEIYYTRLQDAIRGNFPGTEWAEEKGMGVIPCLHNIDGLSVATVTNIPTEKSEKFISQTIEKLLDGVVPQSPSQEYTIILLATPISDVEERKLRLSEIYSGLAPYAGWQTNFTYTESDALGSSATFGINAGVSAGVQNGQNSSIGNTNSEADMKGQNEQESDQTAIAKQKGESTLDQKTHTEQKGETDTKGGGKTNTKGITDQKGGSQGIQAGTSLNVGAAGGVNAIGILSKIVGLSAEIGFNVSTSKAESWSKAYTESLAESENWSKAITKGSSDSKTTGKTISESITETIGKTITKGTSTAKTITNAVSKTKGIFSSTSFGGNFGASFARASNVTATIGKNEGITQSFTNYTVKHALEKLEEQMKRLEQSTALGMWDFAAYVLSEDMNTANNVAHSYLALTQGEQSYMSSSAVNLWRGDKVENSEDIESGSAKEICKYLREFRHPLFALNPTMLQKNNECNFYPMFVTAATNLSGKELAYSLNFPKKSVTGLPVIECAEFGRNTASYEKAASKTIELGNIYHMNHTENTPVDLSMKSLASHTFITGATGTGKSNTVYKMLTEANKKGASFLVIEPAKGEYKDVFGNEKDVSVYGTNLYKSPLLRINPFSFPKDIHILEHLDRLVEIFNVCWPMYAAMPAVLKDAVSQAYVNCGWNLTRSVNKYGCDIYPTFSDVAGCVKEIINSSEYDNDTKGAYKGALLTRLNSLTNGINGLIFTNDELSGEKLFDENVIVDISRVGSNETKSLIMGMLVLKLQEYRMSTRSGLNADLKHITVLEEAHNLLKNTAGVAVGESGNLAGKSVEMLANAIAEMRTYGEGFIIADQAPGLLDKAAIRNTNTKIIMRLPDFEDRELVGKAANLNDDQITELAKLPCGVAAVYQNEWIQPVLCKVEKYEYDESGYIYEPAEDVFEAAENSEASSSLLDCIMKNEIFGYDDKEAIRQLCNMVVSSNLDSKVKVDFMDYISADSQKNIPTLRRLLYDLLSAEKAIDAARTQTDIKTWAQAVVKYLEPSINDYSKRQINLALALLVYEQSVRDAEYIDLYCRFTELYKAEGGVF